MRPIPDLRDLLTQESRDFWASVDKNAKACKKPDIDAPRHVVQQELTRAAISTKYWGSGGANSAVVTARAAAVAIELDAPPDDPKPISPPICKYAYPQGPIYKEDFDPSKYVASNTEQAKTAGARVRLAALRTMRAVPLCGAHDRPVDVVALPIVGKKEMGAWLLCTNCCDETWQLTLDHYGHPRSPRSNGR